MERKAGEYFTRVAKILPNESPNMWSHEKMPGPFCFLLCDLLALCAGMNGICIAYAMKAQTHQSVDVIPLIS